MRRAFRTRRVVAALAVIALGLTGLAATASAESVPCHGDVVVTINGVRLLNQDGSRTAGPYPVALEAGRYRVDAASYDGYHGDPDQITQPNEEWQVITDSGWASGFTIDIPDLETSTYTIFPDNTIPATTSIIVSHRGIGNINSVDPVCVSFTRLPDPTDAADDPEDGEPGPDDPRSSDPEGGPEDPQEPEGSTPADPAEPTGAVPDDGDPDGDDPDGTTPEDGEPAGPSEPGSGEPEDQTPGDPGPDSGGSDDPEGAGPDDGSDPEPEAGTPGPADSDDPEATDDPTGTGDPEGSDDPDVAPPGTDDTSQPIEPEVQGKVEEPGPTPALARTGLEDLTVRLFGLALVFLGLGGLAVRRSEVLPHA